MDAMKNHGMKTTKKYCKRCGKEITKAKVQYCNECKIHNKKAIMSIHNGLCYGTFTVVNDPSEFPIESGLNLYGYEVKCMLVDGSFTENTIIKRGKFTYRVVNNNKIKNKLKQRIIPYEESIK